MSSHKKQHAPTKAMPVRQGALQATGNKSPVAGGKPTPFKKGGKAC